MLTKEQAQELKKNIMRAVSHEQDSIDVIRIVNNIIDASVVQDSSAEDAQSEQPK